MILLGTTFATVRCGAPSHNSSNTEEFDSLGLSAAECEAELMDAFAVSYRPFLSDTSLCLHCHTEGGSSPYKFASTDLPTAFNTFKNLGAAAVDAKALDAAHASGVTGPANAARVSAARSVWDSAYASYQSCLKPSATSVLLEEKNEPALYFGDGQTVTLRWNLGGTEVSPTSARVPGTFSIDARVSYSNSLPTGYVFGNPRIQLATGEVEVEIKGLAVRINRVQANNMQAFLNASKIAKGSDPVSIYASSVVSNSSVISSGDKISIGFVKFNIRARTDNPPIPAVPVLRVNNPFANTQNVGITVSGDTTARRWCITHSSVRPTSTAEPCPGFEGNVKTNGWSTSRPNIYSLTNLGRAVVSGETITLYAWVANSDLKISSGSGSAQVTFDNTAPTAVTWTSLSAATSQMADFIGLTDSSEVVNWCVVEGVTLMSVQAPGACVFSPTKPAFVGLKGGGTRYVNVFVRDRAGNTTTATPKTVVNSFGAISFAQLTSDLTGERGVIFNQCLSCHGSGMPQQTLWDATSYANTVANKAKILNRIDSATAPMPTTGLMNEKSRALIKLWFTQTSTPVQQ